MAWGLFPRPSSSLNRNLHLHLLFTDGSTSYNSRDMPHWSVAGLLICSSRRFFSHSFCFHSGQSVPVGRIASCRPSHNQYASSAKATSPATTNRMLRIYLSFFTLLSRTSGPGQYHFSEVIFRPSIEDERQKSANAGTSFQEQAVPERGESRGLDWAVNWLRVVEG
jgi:hypothetical protein